MIKCNICKKATEDQFMHRMVTIGNKQEQIYVCEWCFDAGNITTYDDDMNACYVLYDGKKFYHWDCV